MSAIVTSSSLNPYPLMGFLKETAPLRKLQAELVEIKQQLDASGLYDETTTAIKVWRQNFFNSVRSDGNVARARQAFTILLQDLLKDPISLQPLDEKALLGSDNRTYSLMSLSIFLAALPEEFKKRSPLDPTNPAPFTTKPHPVVRYMIEWLQKQGAHTLSQAEYQAYRDLVLDGDAPPIPSSIPNDREERIRRLMAKEAKKQQEKKAAILEAEKESIRPIIKYEVVREFAPIDRLVEDMQDTYLGQITDLRRSDKVGLDRIRRNIETLEEEVDVLKERNKDLEKSIESTHGEIDIAKRETAELQMAINATRIMAKKRQQSWGKALLSAVAVTAVCIVASQCMPGSTAVFPESLTKFTVFTPI